MVSERWDPFHGERANPQPPVRRKIVSPYSWRHFPYTRSSIGWGSGQRYSSEMESDKETVSERGEASTSVAAHQGSCNNAQRRRPLNGLMNIYLLYLPAECFLDRTDVQCLHRWQKVLNPELVKGPWSKQEDEIIIQMVKKYGPKKWSTISQALPGRIGKQCRERWHNHLNPQ
uniref:Uncharacterized protein n=1 Tax=Ananas comosus var. bracteatus TaxID=296719 RepID=A0A6V7QUV8_ANACO